MTPVHHAIYVNVRHDVFRICVFVTCNALLANVLPASYRLRRWPKCRFVYEIVVDLVAGFALNWRTHLPSLDQEFLGFKRRFRHSYRNWRQDRLDRLMR